MAHERTDWTTSDEIHYLRHYAGKSLVGINDMTPLQATVVALEGWLKAADVRYTWKFIDKHQCRFAAMERLQQVRDEIARSAK